MAFKLTARTRSILNQIEKNPSFLLDIEGVPLTFASSAVFVKLRWDSGYRWDDDLRWDSSVKDESIKDYISLKDSTRSISQAIYPDKEGSSSITSIQVSIIDKNGEVSRALSNNATGEILGKKCLAALGFLGASYPEDFMPIMNGVIVDYFYKAGSVNLTISHVDSLRRQAILTEYSANLVGSIDNAQTVITVNRTDKLLPSINCLTTYIKIDDEIMQVVSIDSATQLTVIRSELTTIPTTHDNDAEIVSIYRLREFPLTLAQKIMQSTPGNSYFNSDIEIVSFVYVSPTESIANAIIFDTIDIEQSTGLIAGDLVQIDTYGDFKISSFGKLASGRSYIIVNEELPIVSSVSAAWRFKSQYNVLNFGLGMYPFEVDNTEFEYIKNTFSPNFIEMDFFIQDGISNARDFINKELYFVSGCYGIPRNARSSVKFLSPPLSIEDLPVLDETKILNMIDVAPKRSVNNFFYNDVLFAFNKSVIDGDFKSFSQFIDSDSFNTFNVGLKQLRIESEGYKRSTETDLILDRLASRFLDRYKQAAIFIKGIKLPFKHGFNLQVGDVVLFGGNNTQLVNYETGERKLEIEKYEIINQSINLEGEVVVDLLSTGYSVTGSFGVFSPSSLVESASATELVLKKINNLDEVTFERDKWANLFGAKIRVRSEDYSFDHVTTLIGFSLQNPYAIEVESMPIAPVDAIVELALYADYPLKGESDVADVLKLKYTFTMPQTEILSVASNSEFTVSNAAHLFDGAKIAIHSDDYARDNFESTILTVVGNVITLVDALDFTPVIGDKVETRSFTDADGYLFL